MSFGIARQAPVAIEAKPQVARLVFGEGTGSFPRRQPLGFRKCMKCLRGSLPVDQPIGEPSLVMPGTDPQVPLRVLKDAIHSPAGEPIVFRVNRGRTRARQILKPAHARETIKAFPGCYPPLPSVVQECKRRSPQVCCRTGEIGMDSMEFVPDKLTHVKPAR